VVITIDRMARDVTDQGWAWAIVAGVTVINVSFFLNYSFLLL